MDTTLMDTAFVKLTDTLRLVAGNGGLSDVVLLGFINVFGIVALAIITGMFARWNAAKTDSVKKDTNGNMSQMKTDLRVERIANLELLASHIGDEDRNKLAEDLRSKVEREKQALADEKAAHEAANPIK